MNEDCIAIVGQACRLPGAADCEALWTGLLAGGDHVRRFSDAELEAAGVGRDALNDPTYVKRFGYLEGIDQFDAEFFGYTRREAELMDPQHRLLLECAWNALERAGYRPDKVGAKVGVFAGAAPNRYLIYNLLPNESVFPKDGAEYLDQQLIPGSSTDYLTSRISYKLGLTGPSLAVQTACSSSLAAVALACDSLVEYGCDIALAGGVSVSALKVQGYHCPPGGMLSRSGACRPFSYDADGSVFGSGVGLVVLRRLRDALVNGDHIHCIIRGWAVNNDGNAKAGYAAPSVNGQAEAVQAALSMAGVDASSIQLMEAHGSGTPVGDPIEFEALRRVFRGGDRAHCALGSIKANVGHLDAAAGIAGLLKASLSLEHRRIPPAIHFSGPNPQIPLDASAFYLTEVAREWSRGSEPRRAAVNSTGLGGTNVHLVLEEAPVPASGPEEEPYNLLLLSGRSERALERASAELAAHLQAHPEESLTDVAYTLGVGRKHFGVRKAVVATCHDDAVSALGAVNPPRAQVTAGKLAFLFSGTGDQYAGMGLGVYRACGPLRARLDECVELFRAELGLDLRDAMFGGQQWRDRSTKAEQRSGPGEEIDLVRMLKRDGASTAWPASTTHPAVFALEYSLASVLCEWGLRPSSMIGHSIGEYAAACIAGVMTLRDAVRVVAARARLCDGVSEGAMLAVPLAERELEPFLHGRLSVAAVNAPTSCVVSGRAPDIVELERNLKAAGAVAVRMDATRAFHSGMMKDAARELESMLGGIELRAPAIPFVSNVTGHWITPEQATSAAYWGRQLCETVRFGSGLATLCQAPPPALVEIGPGAALIAFAESYLRSEGRPLPPLVHTIPASYRNQSGMPFLLEALGKLWSSGCGIDWSAFYGLVRPRVPLPGYPFERQRYWISPLAGKPRPQARPATGDAVPPAAPVTSPGSSEVCQGPHQSSPPPNGAPSGGRSKVPPKGELETSLAAIWCDVFGLSSVGVTDDFFELGGHSFLALQMANQVWRRLRLDVPMRAILENPTIGELATLLQRNGRAESSESEVDLFALELEQRRAHVEQYIEQKLALFCGSARPAGSPPSRSEWTALGSDLISWFKRDFGLRLYPNELERHADPAALAQHLAESLEARHKGPERPARAVKNRVPGVALVLSSVRAGSTLLRVMLAGHPGLFSPPELHLLPYPDMEKRARGEASPDRDQGLIRAFAEAAGIAHDAATEIVAGFTRENCSTWEVYRRLREACGGRRLVDKSPGNANHPTSLRRAEEYFENAKYIWLVRHPYSVIDSVVRNRFNSLMEAGRLDPHQFGEFLWQRSNANIFDFAEQVGTQRVHMLRYEDLVKDAVGSATKLCHFLDLEFDPSVVKPYEGRRMRDGLGDPNLVERSTIVAELADEWKKVQLPGQLNRATRQLARDLGYDFPAVASSPVSDRCAQLPEKVAAPVLLNKGRPGRPLFLVHPLDGNVFCYVHLARALGPSRPVYALEAIPTPGGARTETSLPGLAAEYVRRVRSVHSSGPFMLGGWSMGGVLAYEMARQLREVGQETELLMIDSPAPLTPSSDYAPDSGYLVALYARFISQRLQVDLDITPDQLKGLDRDEQIEQLWEAAVRHDAMASLDRAELSTRLRVLEDNHARVRRYRPRAYEGNVVLVRAVAERSRFDRMREGEPSWTHEDGKYGWTSLVRGSFRCVDVKADHYSVLGPENAEKIAALWSETAGVGTARAGETRNAPGSEP